MGEGNGARISRFVGSRPLGKTIDLDIINDERVLIKTPLAQSVRHVETVTVPTAAALAEVVRTCRTDQALALGVCGREQARIVVADKLTPDFKAKGVVARTKHNAETGICPHAQTQRQFVTNTLTIPI